MIYRTLFLLLLLTMNLSAYAAITLEQCIALADKNYPLIRKYDLLHRTEQINLSDINKSWLPQISLYGQGTVQNAVPSLPDALSGMMDRTGTEIKGLDKLQYKAGIDISQTVWDGGLSRSRREAEETILAERQAALDVQLYSIRERVENLYFGILLTDEQIKQAELTEKLLTSNLEKVRSMKNNGTALQSDADMIEAQLLTIRQQLIQAKSRSDSYRRMLNIFTGTDITAQELARPEANMPANLTSNRPELRLFEAQTASNNSQMSQIRSTIMPRIGLFAQTYYGYPGFDYFKSMTSRKLSFNALAGIKISWNFSAFYTKKNSELKLKLLSDGIATDRDEFLFNSNLQAQSQTTRIAELKDLMENDSRIIGLRASVRQAAESQLENGIIDTTSLLAKITDEGQARLTAAYHEIQFIQSIYQLKNTLNR